ncbi:MAG: hypothetical protein HY073_02460, partial [Deltaproteobacteria bacterium]|nr:hypothetical protein [Deltaproteobacteria bacterium]
QQLPGDCFSDTELDNLLQRVFQKAPRKSKDHQYALVKRAVSKGELLHIRRGLYCLAPRYQRHPLNLFSLAQKIYGPSYVTAESALSHHGWIPESVPMIISATTKRSRDFKTPLGLFIYRRVLCTPFYAGISRETPEGSSFLMASPLKALLDYVFIYKKEWKGLDPLLNSLRIEEENLKTLHEEELKLARHYRSRRLQRFLSGLRKDLLWR